MSDMEIDMGELLQSFDPPEQPTAMRLEIGTAPAGVSEALVSSMASLANRLEAAEAIRPVSGSR